MLSRFARYLNNYSMAEIIVICPVAISCKTDRTFLDSALSSRYRAHSADGPRLHGNPHELRPFSRRTGTVERRRNPEFGRSTGRDSQTARCCLQSPPPPIRHVPIRSEVPKGGTGPTNRIVATETFPVYLVVNIKNFSQFLRKIFTQLPAASRPPSCWSSSSHFRKRKQGSELTTKRMHPRHPKCQGEPEPTNSLHV